MGSQLTTIGNNVSADGTEIAAKYLNDISKQWTDLVSKQKNKTIAAQNAQFLNETYRTIGETGENLTQEVNDSLTSILTSAELDTREGI